QSAVTADWVSLPSALRVGNRPVSGDLAAAATTRGRPPGGVSSGRGDRMTLDFSRTALVVVDMQYGDAHRDYGLLKDKRAAGQLEAVERYARRLDDLVVPNIQRLLAAC